MAKGGVKNAKKGASKRKIQEKNVGKKRRKEHAKGRCQKGASKRIQIQKETNPFFGLKIKRCILLEGVFWGR